MQARRPPNILDRPIGRGKGEVSLSAFAFLFSEAVQYAQRRSATVADIETRLEELGFGVGVRVLELAGARDKQHKRETRLLPMLQFLSSSVWKQLFGRNADALERSTENDDEFMLIEASPLPNAFVSVPTDLGQLNCAAYTAGIIRGALAAAGFSARVTAHFVAVPDQRDKTVYLMKFASDVMRREARLG